MKRTTAGVACAMAIAASLAAPHVASGEIAPLAGRYSDRTLVVAIEVDRDAARVVAFTVKPRPFAPALVLDPPRAAAEAGPVQVEVVLRGPREERLTRRLDLAGLCLAHAALEPPHVAGDTIRLHREAFLVELPEIAGFDRIEIARHAEPPSGLLRVPLGLVELTAREFRAAGGDLAYADLRIARADAAATAAPDATESTAGATALWPEDFDDTDLIQIFGDPAAGAERINVVIVPDGYTYADKALMEAHASDVVQYFRQTRPFLEHDPFMNYTLVYAYSAQSGTDQCDCGIVLDTAMGTGFPLATPACGHSDNRCLYYGGSCDTDGTAHIVEAELRAPFQDTTIVMVNTERYGGCGGERAVYSAGNSAATDVAVHELGHSLAGLADEYQGIPSCGNSAGEVNTSLDGSDGAWPEWIADIGLPRQGGQYFDQCVYRPLSNCEMRSLFSPFCPVCNQRWSLKTFGNPRVAPTAPIAAVAPPAGPVAAGPWDTIDFAFEPRLSVGPVTNSISWVLTKPGGNPQVVAAGVTSHAVTFAQEGSYTLALEVIADTNFVKPQKTGANRDTKSWAITVAASAPPAEVSPPGAAAPLVFTGRFRLQWEPLAESGATSFRLYRGTLQALPAGNYGSCILTGILGPTALVAGQPPPGQGWFYLVAGANSAGEGTLGSASSGAPRVPGTACNP